MRLDEHHRIKDWVQGCCENDRQCQENLYRHYFDSMVRLVKRYTRDDDHIISIVNDGFLKAFKNIEHYNFTGSLEGWLRTIVFRALSDHFRKRKSDFKMVPLLNKDEISQNDGPSGLYFEDLLEHLKKLPTMSRKVFELYAVQGYLHREIAEILDISEGTSKWHVSEARSRLKEILKKKEIKKYV